MHRLTGGEAIVRQLEREGVDVVFGIAGVHTLDIYDALIDSEIEQITTRHEQGAGFMADGYARTTGRVGVTLLITGPGLTNAATPIGQAYSDSSPMLIISSENETNEASRGKGYLHEVKDQQGMMENLVAYSERVERVSDIPRAIADAFDYLETNRPRPVHIQIATDLLERTEPVEPFDRPEPSLPPIDDDRLDRAVDMLADAEQPLLLLGGGASGATEEIRQFVDRTGIPVASTVAGKGIVPADHERNLGATLRDPDVSEYASDRDLVLAVGTQLSPMDTRGIDFTENLIHVDIDYRNFGRTYPTELGIVGDAERAMDELLDRVEERDISFGDEHREAVAELKADGLGYPTDEDDQRHQILAALRDALDSDAVVVNDMTKLCYEASGTFPADEPDTFLFPRGYGTLGFSPPAAFGAGVGNPDRQVVGLVGDGGFLFTVQALSTAVKYDIGVPIVVINDECYGVLEDNQVRDYDGRTIGTRIENPEFVEMARTFGAAGERLDVDEVDTALPDALAAAFERDRPTVIEIPVDF